MRAPDFWAPGKGGVVATLLSPIGAIVGAITAAHVRKAPTWTASVPVICVGNAVMGGAGKTQISRDIADRLKARGQTPHIIMRGYGGRLAGPIQVDPQQHTATDVGDEAILLAGAVPTWIARQRPEAARAAVAAGADVIIMDDGFQNPSLAKTISLLVIDAGYRFGNGYVFPAGPLRERASAAFQRADAVCVIGTPGASLPTLPSTLPRFDALTVPAPSAPAIEGQKVVAFAGIGRPEKFFQTLRDVGADVIKTHSFPDHHAFSDTDIAACLQLADTAGAKVLTTEKDHVRLPKKYHDRVTAYPVCLKWQDADAFDAFIAGALKEGG